MYILPLHKLSKNARKPAPFAASWFIQKYVHCDGYELFWSPPHLPDYDLEPENNPVKHNLHCKEWWSFSPPFLRGPKPNFLPYKNAIAKIPCQNHCK